MASDKDFGFDRDTLEKIFSEADKSIRSTFNYAKKQYISQGKLGNDISTVAALGKQSNDLIEIMRKCSGDYIKLGKAMGDLMGGDIASHKEEEAAVLDEEMMRMINDAVNGK